MYMHESRLLNCDLDISPLLFQFFHLRDHSLVDFTFCQKARQMNLLRVWHVLTDIVKKYFYPSFTSAVFSELWTEPLLPWTKCTWPFWATDIQLICLEEQPSIIENAFLQIAPPLTLNRLSVSPKIDQEQPLLSWHNIIGLKGFSHCSHISDWHALYAVLFATALYDFGKGESSLCWLDIRVGIRKIPSIIQR